MLLPKLLIGILLLLLGLGLLLLLSRILFDSSQDYQDTPSDNFHDSDEDLDENLDDSVEKYEDWDDKELPDEENLYKDY